jgi:SAM-dependent methyltransferase
MRVLEIGPDEIPSAFLDTHIGLEKDIECWNTADMRQAKGLTYLITDPYKYPISDETYDMVISANVFEHVPKVWVWMTELARITKPGGCVATICPVNWKYHQVPVDCWRAYPDGVKAVYEWAGLVPVTAYWGCMEESGQQKDTVVVGRKNVE